MATGKKPKPPRRKCKICRDWFDPRFSNEWWCCPDHGYEYSQQLMAKKKIDAERRRKETTQQEKRSLKIRKAALQPLSYYHRQTQAAFNEYIRNRDADQPCISCGRYHEGKYDAGHYRTRGASPATRYDETNCHKQCVPCNQHLSGNIENYTPNLIKKIGQAAFDQLMGPHPFQKWTREQLQELARHYRQKTRQLLKQQEQAA